MLLADVEAEAAGASGANTGTKDFETLDRIISSDAEEDATGGSQAGYYDPYAANATIDRDSGTDFDCTVESASGTIGTNGVLTDDTLRTFLRKIRIAAGKDPAEIEELKDKLSAANADRAALIARLRDSQIQNQLKTEQLNDIQTALIEKMPIWEGKKVVHHKDENDVTLDKHVSDWLPKVDRDEKV